MSLLRNPTWLVAIAGDFVGFLLNIAALSTGPVVVIQPLVVLMLPIALVVGWRLGGPRPRTGEWLGSAGIILGLASFLALVGKPGEGHTPQARYIALTIAIVLLVGALISVSVLKRGATLRGSVYGAAAGIYFGTLGVMVDGASNVVAKHGVGALFTTWRGLDPLLGIIVLGTGGIILTQVSFQIGHLAATLPANLAADPVTAVLIGALLLHEHIPLGPGYLCGYIACLALVIAGTMRLARRADKAARAMAAAEAAARMSG
jgi:drug/metabolite transporter (DMT)-like permease